MNINISRAVIYTSLILAVCAWVIVLSLSMIGIKIDYKWQSEADAACEIKCGYQRSRKLFKDKCYCGIEGIWVDANKVHDKMCSCEGITCTLAKMKSRLISKQ